MFNPDFIVFIKALNVAYYAAKLNQNYILYVVKEIQSDTGTALEKHM